MFGRKKRNALLIFTLLLLFLCKNHASSQRGPNYINDSIELSQVVDSAISTYQYDYEKSMQIALEGLSKYENTQYVIGKISLLLLLAEIHYYYKNSFDSSLIYLNRMKQLSDSIELPRGTAWYNLNLANIYYYQDINYEKDNLGKALDFYILAKEQAEKIRDTVIVMDALIGIADIRMRHEEYTNSLAILYQVLEYANRTKILQMQFLVYDDIANIFKLTEQYDSSYYYYQKTLEVVEKLGNQFGELVTNLNLLYVAYMINPNQEVLPELRAILEESSKNGFMRLYLDTGHTICTILEDKNRFEEAYLLYQQITTVRDSIYSTDMVRKVAEYESAYKLMKSKLKNKNLTNQNEISTLKLKNRLIIIILAIFMFVQAVILLIIIYRKYGTIRQNLQTIKDQERKIFEQEKKLIEREKEVIEQKLRYRDKEQAIKAMKIFHHNQLIEKFVKNLEALKLYISRDGNKRNSICRLQDMINEMNYTNNDNVWKEFETIFVESNPGYLEKLHKRYPNLTLNEKKLCVFLYLNMRTKDISSITQQSNKSVNVARTRLRKKLNLENTNINLSSFLQSIK